MVDTSSPLIINLKLKKSGSQAAFTKKKTLHKRVTVSTKTAPIPDEKDDPITSDSSE